MTARLSLRFDGLRIFAEKRAVIDRPYSLRHIDTMMEALFHGIRRETESDQFSILIRGIITNVSFPSDKN